MHTDLAIEIDAAVDDRDELKLHGLAEECLKRLEAAVGVERINLHYYNANCHAGISAINYPDSEFVWSWNQPHGIAEVLALRRAVKEPEFEDAPAVIISQIRTNLGNRLSSLGRPVAACEQWLSAGDSVVRFAKALANKGKGLAHYAGTLYDYSHTAIMLATARNDLINALASDAIWESGDREMHVSSMSKHLDDIAGYLERISYQEDFDLNQWPLGGTDAEISYREWCLNNRLFLNPLNDAYLLSVAATDVLHLPDHVYKVGENPRFPAYFNLLKQEYVSARYRLYRALHEDDPEYVMRDVKMIDTGEGQVLGHHTEELRSSLRAAYSIFDKIGLFLNDYFQLGHKASQVSFTSVWREKTNKANSELHPTFQDRQNWPLRGLYFLSRDLLEDKFQEVAEPDAADLAKLRHQAEHRFLSLQYYGYGDSTPTHTLIDIDKFGDKTLRMLKTAREAIIYISLAMHREEQIKAFSSKDDDKIVVPIFNREVSEFDRI